MIYIFLPAYNEAEGLKNLLENISQVLRNYVYKIILVNDGSTDATEKIACSFQTFLPIEIINHAGNRGLGEAFKTGMKRILRDLESQDIVVTLDADNTHPPSLIPQMVTKISKGLDLVIASRFCPEGKEIGLKFLRRLFSRGACWLLKLFFPYPEVKDYTSGYRAYLGELLTEATNSYGEELVTAKGFTVMAEILIKLRKFRPKVAEIPLILRYDLKKGKSKIKILRTIAQYFRLILKYRYGFLVFSLQFLVLIA